MSFSVLRIHGSGSQMPMSQRKKYSKTMINFITQSMCGKAPSLVTEDSNILGVSRLYVGGYNLSN